jgi:hypothetical protein
VKHFPGTEIRFTNRAINTIHEMMLQEQKASPPSPPPPPPPPPPNFYGGSYYQPPPPPPPPQGPDPYAVLGVTEGAPDEVVKAAYKAQARRCHADLGGDDKRMKEINAAYEEIRRSRQWTK